MSTVAQQTFDTQVFGLPYFRVVDLNAAALERELPALLTRRPIIVDAKVPAGRPDLLRFLLGLGFRSVCTQVTLAHALATLAPPARPIDIRARVELDAETVRAHAANFGADRFARDPLISGAEHDRFYALWIENSLDGRMQVAVQGRNFCSFRPRGRDMAIDLLSVLEKGRGIGRDLVCAMLAEAARRRSTRVTVVTECGNSPSWRLYRSCGFEVEAFTDCLHFVAR